MIYHNIIEVLPFLISGALLGSAVGISPGPVLTLVISETLTHGKKAGIKVAFAPVITGLPVAAVALLAVSKITESHSILGLISLIGAVFVAYLAYESLTIKDTQLKQGDMKARSLRKGVIADFLNPHLYLFWAAVGAPAVLKAYGVSLLSAISFFIGFYILLVGFKISIALITSKSKQFLKSHVYIYAIKILGASLLVFSLLFVKEGLVLLGVL